MSAQRVLGGSAIPAGKFAVASDADGAIAKSYDLKSGTAPSGMKDTRGVVVDHVLTERTTFVVGPDGKILATLSSAADKISPAEHVFKALDVVKTWKSTNAKN